MVVVKRHVLAIYYEIRLLDDDDNHILEIYLSQCVPYIIKSSIVNYLCVYLRPLNE